MLTYRDLLNTLQRLEITENARLDDTVTVWDAEEDEYFGVGFSTMASAADVLDKGHLFLACKY